MTALLTVPQVAALLKVHPRYVYQAAAEGRLKTCRFGRALRFAEADVEAFVAASTV